MAKILVKLEASKFILKYIVHENLKRYNCDKCGKSFRFLSNLRKHKENEGQRKYKCNECGKSFGQAVNLRKHIKVAHI